MATDSDRELWRLQHKVSVLLARLKEMENDPILLWRLAIRATFRCCRTRLRALLALTVAVLFLAACGSAPESSSVPPTATPSPKPKPSPTISNEAARQAVLKFKACPQQGDTLTEMIAYALTIAQDKPSGSEVIGRSGPVVKVAIDYTENGQAKKSVFDYDSTTGQVTGEDSFATESLANLKAECPS